VDSYCFVHPPDDLHRVEFLSRSWFHGVFPVSFNRAVHGAITSDRVLFAVLTALITYRGIQQRRDTWFIISALLLVSVGLFAQEFSQLGIKGIWLPFGTGVSRTDTIRPTRFSILLCLRCYGTERKCWEPCRPGRIKDRNFLLAAHCLAYRSRNI
jgi:hypothetical protein